VWALWETAVCAVFHVPVGAFCASAGTAASTRWCSLRRWGKKAIAIQNRELMACRQVGAARSHVAVMLRSASQINFVAASSLGKCPRVLMILRRCA
jgi:hypothetical protein